MPARILVSDCIRISIADIAQKPSEPEKEENVQMLFPGMRSSVAQRLPAKMPITITLMNDGTSFLNVMCSFSCGDIANAYYSTEGKTVSFV